MTDRRLIEAAFPLRQVSLDSVHEKNVRHGHISTLHIWPARRPLAAARAALLALLLPDPGDGEARRKLLMRMAGRIVETQSGICRWGREADSEIEIFRTEIRATFGGQAPRVLDPFAGGGAIPLEAMRLGCEAVAVDINPVAWFILRCTLHYPRLVAGRTRPLPAFALQDRGFMDAFLKAHGGAAKQVVLFPEAQQPAHRNGTAAAQCAMSPSRSTPGWRACPTGRGSICFPATARGRRNASRSRAVPVTGQSRWKPTNGSRPATWVRATGSTWSLIAARRHPALAGAGSFCQAARQEPRCRRLRYLCLHTASSGGRGSRGDQGIRWSR